MSELPSLWPNDPWGRILNGAVLQGDLPSYMTALCEEAVDLFHQRFGADLHSVYLTGELARNQGNEPEFIAVLNNNKKPLGADMFAAAAGLRLQKENPGFGSCQFNVYAWEDVFPADGRFSLPRFKIAVNSVVVAGRDLKGLIAPQRLSASMANAWLFDLEQRLSGYVHRLKAVSTESRVYSTSKQFARAAIEGAFAIVLLDEQVYTQDLEVMARIAGLHFPDHRSNLAALARIGKDGTRSGIEALGVAQSTMLWLSKEANLWLDKHNPDRANALGVI